MRTDLNNTKKNYPTTYREVKIGNTFYCVTSVFKGEKKLGPTLEKLATQHIIDQMNNTAIELLRT